VRRALQLLLASLIPAAASAAPVARCTWGPAGGTVYQQSFAGPADDVQTLSATGLSGSIGEPHPHHPRWHLLEFQHSLRLARAPRRTVVHLGAVARLRLRARFSATTADAGGPTAPSSVADASATACGYADQPHYGRVVGGGYLANRSLASKLSPTIRCTVVSLKWSGRRRSTSSGSGASEGAR
jgi:hypothetical protein